MTPASLAVVRTPLESATLARVAWLIGMRCFFVFSIVVGAWVGGRFFPDLELAPFLQIASLAALFNLLVHVINARVARLPEERKKPLVQILIQAQVLADWLVLLFIIHHTGGIESPLLHFFIFHLALSAVFLSPGFTVLALAFIVAALSLLFAAEATGILEPVQLSGLTNPANQRSWSYILHVSFWHFSTLAVMAFLLGAVMRGLRRREAEALRIRRRLEKANQDILRISEERIRLMHTMGHELRSPIAAAQSMLSALELSHGAELPAPARGIHQRISSRLKGLTGLIGELLDLAEQRREPSRPVRRVELGGLLAGLMEDLEAHAAEAGLRLERQWTEGRSVHVSGDPERLRRIFENLLTNALKYSRPGGVVRVGLTLPAAEDRPPQVEVWVSDEGIGIAPDQLPRLFSEFYRTPQSRRHTTQGTGLGLAITKSMVEAAGGEILVESELERGSTFRVRLPRLV
ncbi:MAG: HAMP domain-containing sensor histidine kinase [bacterium]|nr:HAMP domain-containing sensor histidine kinase [bacterium]